MTDNRCVLQELSEPIGTYARFRYVPCSAVGVSSLAGAVAIPRRIIVSGTAVLLAISLKFSSVSYRRVLWGDLPVVRCN